MRWGGLWNRMEAGSVLLLCVVTVSFICLCVSFITFVPMVVNLHEFDRRCLLYGSGSWEVNLTDGKSYLADMTWGPASACQFQLFFSLLSAALSALFLTRGSLLLFKGTSDSWLSTFITFILSIIMSVFAISGALVLSIGFKRWCDLIVDIKSQILSCDHAEYITFLQQPNIFTHHFFMEMELAQFGIWTSWFCWLLLLLFSILKFRKSSERESFMSSLKREKEWLLHRTSSAPAIMQQASEGNFQV